MTVAVWHLYGHKHHDGTARWAMEVERGLEALGIEYVSVMQGKNLDDLKRDDVDTVILSNLIWHHEERAAKKEGREPKHLSILEWLRAVGKRTIVGAHGGVRTTYPKWAHPDQVLNLATDVWTTHASFLDGVTLSHVPPKVLSDLPFSDPLDPQGNTENRGVIMTGRVTSTKGQHVLAELWAEGHIPATCIIAGKGMMSNARTILDKQTAKDHIHLISERDIAYKNWQGLWTLANQKLIDVEHPPGWWLEYTGEYRAYTDDPKGKYGPAPWKRANVHVNLTYRRISPGHLEYSSLEAMAKGKQIVVPRFALPEEIPYKTVTVIPDEAYTNHKDLSEAQIGDTIASALDQRVDLDERRADLALHDPAVYVRELLA